MKFGVTFLMAISLPVVVHAMGFGVEQPAQGRSWYEVARDFQSVVGLLGIALAGLIAFSTTKMHDERRQLEAAKSLARALAAEVLMNALNAQVLLDDLKQAKQDAKISQRMFQKISIFMKRGPINGVYFKSVGDIGMLPGTLVFRTVTHYTSIRNQADLSKAQLPAVFDDNVAMDDALADDFLGKLSKRIDEAVELSDALNEFVMTGNTKKNLLVRLAVFVAVLVSLFSMTHRTKKTAPPSWYVETPLGDRKARIDSLIRSLSGFDNRVETAQKKPKA